MELIAQRGVASVDDRFQLGADAIEVHGGRRRHHICPQELGVDLLHIVLLDALFFRMLGTSLTADAGVNVVVRHRDNLHLMPCRPCAFCTGLRQGLGVAIAADAAH